MRDIAIDVGVVPEVGLEPTLCFHKRILSPSRLPFRHSGLLEVPPGFEPGNRSFAGSCLTTWLWYHNAARPNVSRSRLYNISNRREKCNCLSEDFIYFSFDIAFCQFSRRSACVKCHTVHTILSDMYEMEIGVGPSAVDWLKKIERDVRKSGITAVAVCVAEDRRAHLCIGTSGKSADPVKKLAAKSVRNILLCDVKRRYIGKRLRRLKLGASARNLLVHALTVFDRETEDEMLCEILHIGKVFDLDGFRHFRMRELYSRWDEMCELAGRHDDYLRDEETLYDLLKYLVNAERRSGAKAEVYRLEDKYRLIETSSGDGREEKIFDRFDDLICRLIDFAPGETLISGFEYDDKYRKLSNIFGARVNILQ